MENYESKRGLVDLESQREATVNQIKDLEQQRNIAQSTINASKKTIKDLEGLIDENAPLLPKTVTVHPDNSEIILTNKKILNLKKNPFLLHFEPNRHVLRQ